jgi:hypothetical protein
MDVYPSAKTVAGSIGIEPNNYITSAEGKDISIKSKEFMSNGISHDKTQKTDNKMEKLKQRINETQIKTIYSHVPLSISLR